MDQSRFYNTGLDESNTDPWGTTSFDPALYIGADDSVLRGSIFYNNDVGINIRAAYTGGGSSAENNWFYHNTIYDSNFMDADDKKEYDGVAIMSFTGTGFNMVDNSFVNNIIWKTDTTDHVITRISLDANSGQNTVYVAFAQPLKPGSEVIINHGGSNEEICRIEYRTTTDNYIRCYDDLQYSHEVNEPVSFVDRLIYMGIDSGGLTPEGNVFRNNIFGDPDFDRLYYAPNNKNLKLFELVEADSEWESTNIKDDPLFVAPHVQNFELMDGSPAIDAGSYITKASASGIGTNMVVEDSTAFFSKSAYGLEYDDPELVNDVIFVDNPTAQDFNVEIVDIDYDLNGLTLETSKEWQNDAEIYWCPNGVCFSGSAPDLGARMQISKKKR